MNLGIEILEPSKMSTNGSSVLRSLQNNYMPNTDLFVRESIQNSLDAAADDDSSSFVSVDFSTGEFVSSNFSSILTGVSDKLNNDFGGIQYYLSVRDTNTVGLTGPLTHDSVNDASKFGNFVKLVYEISKPQEQENSGGSWGYGKTIYFRMGIGTVIYYSRIKNKKTKFEERLVITHVEKVEDEGILPKTNNIKTGIAWWGKKSGENRTEPITDSNEIKEILDIFKIRPYEGNQTGTQIIIPYIDKKNLRLQNRDLKNLKKDMYNSLEDYLGISVQRWYAPRLNNEKYPYGKYLKVSVNGEQITLEKQDIFFDAIRSMYQYTYSSKMPIEGLEKTDIIIHSNKDAQFENKVVGTLVYKCFDYTEFEMTDMGHGWDPYLLTNLENRDDEGNREVEIQNPPIILYSRSPGMIVNYENSGEWLKSVPSMHQGKYLIALFVLNSKNMLKFSKESTSLDEYIRKGERADHSSWEDHSEFGLKETIVSRIKKNVSLKLRNRFTNQVVDEQLTTTTGRLSKLLGDKLLPPVTYGKIANINKPKVKTESRNIQKQSFGSFELFDSLVSYDKNGIQIPFTIHLTEPKCFISVEVQIDSVAGSKSILSFEEDTALKSPISIGNIQMRQKDIDYDINMSMKDLNNIETYYTAQRTMYKIKFYSESMDMINGEIYILSDEKNFVPSVSSKIEKGNGVLGDE